MVKISMKQQKNRPFGSVLSRCYWRSRRDSNPRSVTGWVGDFRCRSGCIVPLAKCQTDESDDSFSKSPSSFPEATIAIMDLAGSGDAICAFGRDVAVPSRVNIALFFHHFVVQSHCLRQGVGIQFVLQDQFQSCEETREVGAIIQRGVGAHPLTI